MYIQTAPDRVVVHSPAKLNLFLEVLARRPDGFHEIETLMTAIDLCDTLIATPRSDAELRLTCVWAGGAQARDASSASATPDGGRSLESLPEPGKNIVVRALALLQQRHAPDRGLDVQLVKRIPAAAGLGGASSDAAAALIAANRAWGLDLPLTELSAIAAQIGSDIPFFFSHGSAICRGRGEQIEAIEAARLHVVVVRPPEGLSTPEVYRHCRPADSPASSLPLREALARGNTGAAARLMLNRLQEPAARLSGWIARLQEEFDRLDCVGHQMSGSGSSYFGLCHHARHARRTAARLRARGLGSVHAVATAHWSPDSWQPAR
jgi:4-diphosphocytidyl-2-C-methyl-D-erythritol kinase